MALMVSIISCANHSIEAARGFLWRADAVSVRDEGHYTTMMLDTDPLLSRRLKPFVFSSLRCASKRRKLCCLSLHCISSSSIFAR